MKKNYILAVVALLLSFTAKAQVSKGTIFLGGTLGFEFSSTDRSFIDGRTSSYKFTSFTVAPSVGFFVADKTAIGLFGNFTNFEGTTTFSSGDRSTTTRTPISMGAFVERFFMVVPKFGFTGRLSGNYIIGSSKTESTVVSSNSVTVIENNIRGFSVGLRAGIIWFPAPHIGLRAGAGVLSYRTEKDTQKNSNPEVSTTESGFNFITGSTSLNFGLNYFFFR
jgi:outer membrane protein